MKEGEIGVFICDPPYFLGFMGKDFDKQDGADQDPKVMQERHEEWLREAYRVLPPGGVIKAFSGTRTYHRLAAAMEAVGFVLDPERSLEAWVYGSGFPKSLNISKALDKHHGAEREVVGKATHLHSRGKNQGYPKGHAQAQADLGNVFTEDDTPDVTAPATDDAKRFEGYGTALKPAWEPILIGRKPYEDELDFFDALNQAQSDVAT
jgi:site-specific DNA-methyltransferase (adenine-specific)